MQSPADKHLTLEEEINAKIKEYINAPRRLYILFGAFVSFVSFVSFCLILSHETD